MNVKIVREKRDTNAANPRLKPEERRFIHAMQSNAPTLVATVEGDSAKVFPDRMHVEDMNRVINLSN
jgi:hypothetical protein